MTPERLAEYESRLRQYMFPTVTIDELRELIAAYRKLAEIEAAWGTRSGEDWADLDPSERPRF